MMIRRLLTCALALALAPSLSPLSARAQKLQTPAPEDVPAPVPGDIGLAGAECPDIARYLNARSAAAPSLSPDGARVAYRTSVTGSPQIWIADTRVGSAPRQITFGEPVTFHEWSPAGDWIAYGVDRGGNEREGFYLIAPDGARERELLPPSESFRAWGGFSRDGKRIAYAATEPGKDDFDIYTLDLAPGARPRRVHEGKGGIYVASWRPDGAGLLLTVTRGEDANDVLYLDLRTNRTEVVFRPREAASYSSFAWTPDSRGFYLATNQDRDFAALAFYDFSARRLIFVHEPQRDVEGVALSADGRHLAWAENAEGFSEIRLRDLSRPQPGAAPRTVTAPRGVVYALDWAARAPVLAVQLSGPDIPGDIWVHDAVAPMRPARPLNARRAQANSAYAANGAATLSRVTVSSLAGLDPQKFVAPRAVSFPSHDGVTIHGLLYLPRGASTQKRAPVVLGVHGGPTSQARPDFDAVFQYLLARGYAVLDLNFRGSTGYGKKFARLDNGRLRPNAVKDMAAAVDWLAASGHPVDARKAAVMGGSYGGYMTYAALAQLPEKFAAGVSFVGVSNWVTALEGASPQLKASDRIEYGNIDDPEDRKFFEELSPIRHVRNVRAPLLVSHGANDPRDPVAESDQFVRAIRERGGEVEYLRWPDEGHSIRKLQNRITAYRRVARFLERTLGRGTVDCNRNETSAAPVPPAGAALAAEAALAERVFAHPVDSFGPLPCGDELARLNNLASQLNDDPKLTAYIVARGANRPRPYELRSRLLRMQAYLVNKRGVPASRVVALDAGGGGELKFALFLFPADDPHGFKESLSRGKRISLPKNTRRVTDCQDIYDRPELRQPVRPSE
jgi:dipeptidyl aminopeptidase/acylaminoacyl peptidase